MVAPVMFVLIGASFAASIIRFSMDNFANLLLFASDVVLRIDSWADSKFADPMFAWMRRRASK